MLAEIWATIQFLRKLWDALLVLIGIVKKEQHEHAKEDIKENTDVLNNPNSTEQERLDALKKLQDRLNSRA